LLLISRSFFSTFFKGLVMRKNLYVMSGKPGFTLIEMVVTISIFSILAAIAIPSFITWLPGYNLKSAARDVFSNMQMAKLDAIKRNASCTVTFDTGAKTYTVALSEGNKMVNLSDYDANILFTNSTVGAITFTSRGFSNPSGIVRVTNTQNTATYQIQVETVGTIKMTKL
jgi:prepilin-type N-terminal cleavage/methylation domain-containing protein